MSISADRRRRAIADAIDFEQFVATASNFVDEFRANYDAVEFTADELARLSATYDGVDVLAIVEDWCPDVVANLPILARVAADTGAIRLHVVVRRPDTRDIADSYPYEGRSHIPTYVFFKGDGPDLGVIVERTAPVRTRVDDFLAGFFAEHPHLDRATFPAGLSEPDRATLLEQSLQFRRDIRDLERSSFVDAIVEVAHIPAPAAI
jgi:hypothetical protein